MGVTILAGHQEQLVETLYRCETCGKWSHAKRRPTYHERFAGDEGDLTDEQASAVTRTAETTESDTGAINIVCWVRCGPFARWLATRTEFRD
jgi:hypothetical protein